MVRTYNREPAKMSAQELQRFRENVDGWIRDINSQMGNVAALSTVVQENASNIQHNYEVMQQLIRQIEDLKNEIETVKLMQIISLNQHNPLQKDA